MHDRRGGGGAAGGDDKLFDNQNRYAIFLSLTAMQKLNVVYNFTKIICKLNDLIGEYDRSHQLKE